MDEQDKIRVNGEVVRCFKDGYIVVLEDIPSEVYARLSGRMRIHKIRIETGDSVEVELSPYDVFRGRITWRWS